MEDSTILLSDAISNITSTDNSVSIWLWIALIEFTMLTWLLIKLYGKRKSKLDLADLKKSDLKSPNNVNMNDLVNSIHHSKDLYKELSRKCHPDRFVNTPQQKIAEEIFQNISENKRNYNQLLMLKEEAKNKLNINLL